MSRKLKLSTARDILVFMAASADHITGKTGLTLTITESKAAGAFGATSPTVTERTNGWYQIALTGTNTNTLGDYALHITGTDADPTDVLMEVVAVDQEDAVRFGLTALPNAAAEAAGGLYTRGSGAGQINQPANGMVDVNTVRHLGSAYISPTVAGLPKADVMYWNGSAVANPNVAGVPKVDVTHVLGVAAPDLNRTLGLLHDNSVVDNQVYGAFGITSARVRVFASAGAAGAATKGAADDADGEVYRYVIAATYDVNGLDDYRLVREL